MTASFFNSRAFQRVFNLRFNSRQLNSRAFQSFPPSFLQNFSQSFSQSFSRVLLAGSVTVVVCAVLTGCSPGEKTTSSDNSIAAQKNDEDEIIVINLTNPTDASTDAVALTDERSNEYSDNQSEELLGNNSEVRFGDKSEKRDDFTKKPFIGGAAPASADHKRASIPSLNVPQPKNVVLMIADGAGFGAFYSAADFTTGSPQGLFYQQSPWSMTSVATFHKKSFYDTQKDWDDFKNLRVPFYEKEPAFIPPDSASTGTALMTGVKTRNGRVGVGPNDERLETIAEIFHKKGRRTGAVTSFQIASATMATAAAHDPERKNGQKMFAEMLLDGNLDVIIGAGHPEFNDDGQRRKAVFGKYGPSQELWSQIHAGALPNGWMFTDSLNDIQSLATRTPDQISPSDVPLTPIRLLALAPVANSFQCHRKAGSPPLPTSPTLAQATLAALNVLAFTPQKGMLKPNAKGFFLLAEGGAVDVANDANDLVRCVEEMTDFNQAVAAVCDWVEKYSSWDETLVIVTADHDNGAIYGPETGADGIPLSAPIYRGKGNLPVAKYYSDDHTKQLVPLYARGAGSERFLHEFTVGIDKKMGKFWNYDGRFIDNTAVFRVMTGEKP